MLLVWFLFGHAVNMILGLWSMIKILPIVIQSECFIRVFHYRWKVLLINYWINYQE